MNCAIFHEIILEGICHYCNKAIVATSRSSKHFLLHNLARDEILLDTDLAISRIQDTDMRLLICITRLFADGRVSANVFVAIAEGAIYASDSMESATLALVGACLDIELATFNSPGWLADVDKYLCLKIMTLAYMFRKQISGYDAQVEGLQFELIRQIITTVPWHPCAKRPECMLLSLRIMRHRELLAQQWLAATRLHPDNCMVLSNAALNLLRNRELSIDLIDRAIQLSPNEFPYRKLKAKLLALDKSKESIVSAIKLYTSCLDLLTSSSIERVSVLREALCLAIKIKDYSIASGLSKQITTLAGQYPGLYGLGNAVHLCCLLASELAFIDNDIELALEHLALATKTFADNQWGSESIPGLAICNMLLSKGYCTEVILYLEGSKSIWGHSDHIIDIWIYGIRSTGSSYVIQQ